MADKLEETLMQYDIEEFFDASYDETVAYSHGALDGDECDDRLLSNLLQYPPGPDDYELEACTLSDVNSSEDSGESATKCSNSTVSESSYAHADDLPSHPSSDAPPAGAATKKRKIDHVDDLVKEKAEAAAALAQESARVAELERRLALTGKENKDLRQQLAALKQANRALQGQLQYVLLAQQQPYLATFAQNVQDALTVSPRTKTKASTGVSLCIFFLLGAFFIPGLFNTDVSRASEPLMLSPGAKVEHLALPEARAHLVEERHSLSSLSNLGRNLLALPMADTEAQKLLRAHGDGAADRPVWPATAAAAPAVELDYSSASGGAGRDAVFMCPRVVGVHREEMNEMKYISVVIPSASLPKRSDYAAAAPNAFSELMCEVRSVLPVSNLSLKKGLQGSTAAGAAPN